MDKMQQAVPLPGSGSLEPTAGTARLLTVIACAPGLAERSLRATLESLSSIQVICTATGCLTALQMVRDRQADLVVLDANLHLEEVQELLRLLDREGRDTRCLVLAETTRQVYRALAAGADAALRWDSSIQELSAALSRLQRPHRAEPQRSQGDLPAGS